jgi:hypothetical protein
MRPGDSVVAGHVCADRHVFGCANDVVWRQFGGGDRIVGLVGVAEKAVDVTGCQGGVTPTGDIALGHQNVRTGIG